MKFFKRNPDKYLSKEQLIKKSFWKGLAISFILVPAIVALYQFLIVPQAVLNTQKNIENANRKGEIVVFKLKTDLPQGSVITLDNIEETLISKESAPEDVIQKRSEFEDHVLRVSLKANALLTTSLLTSMEDAVTDDLREQDYSHFILNKNLVKGDYVDIRIKLRDGRDFIVAAKKKVHDINGSTAFLQISESERTYINNATVMAANSEGSELYTTIYVDPENQPQATVDYVLDEEILKKIEENKKLVKEAEEALKERNRLAAVQASQATAKSAMAGLATPESQSETVTGIDGQEFTNINERQGSFE